MLHIHRAERADALIEALGRLLAEPLADPFAPDVISVPTRGMERWLTQRMSASLGATPGRADGICANVEFPFPRRLAGDAVAAASGIDPETDPWLPQRAVWPLLDVVGECLHEPWLASLARHLRKDDDVDRRARRFATVRHLSELFDRYALHRPAMVCGWERGEIDVPQEAAWQAELWRRLRKRLAAPSPAERLEPACGRLRAEPGLLPLPERISLFGLTRLPAGHLDVLRALAAGREVHVFLLHPSPALWEKIGDRPPVVRRAEDTTASLPDNRLLASWGQDAREMQLVLGTHEHAGHHHPIELAEDTLLGRIQADVRADRSPPGIPLPGVPDARPHLDRADRSVQIHACHGRARQVEVLRDAILHLLAEDDTLQPRDVIVMCPDIETFAPLIQATFGAGEAVDEDELEPLADGLRPTDLRVRLADRSLRQTNPVLGVVAQLLDLASRRLTASDVLDLADREPVRRRFRLEDEDLARIRDWVADSGIRWGLDAEHRRPFKLQDLAAGTWKAGLDRVLVGVTMTEEGHRLFEGVLPVDDVESLAIDLAGRLAELVDRLQDAVDEFNTAKPIREWVGAIATAADALTATSQRDAWQRAQLERILDDVVREAAGGAVALTLHEVRALLAERLQGRPTRANFRTGHLTICTLVPMRSVPHRVVCLLGLDDAAFPRKAPRDGDDIMLLDPHVGERDPRAEDRQMLLDALMAASDRLIVTYAGSDVRTNTPRPPAVPVGELLDVIERTVQGDARAQVLVRHPLQPFDPRNFSPGVLGGERAWSFNRVTLDGARAMQDERTEAPRFLTGPLPPQPSAVVELEDVVNFVRHPVRAFLRQRLGFSVATYADEVDDALPIDLDNLESWQIGQRLLDARLAGATETAAVGAELARGSLPPGNLSGPVIEKLLPQVEQIVQHAAALLPGATESGSVDVRVALPGGRRLSGTVPDVYGTLLRAVTYSRVSPRHRLMTWVRFLALSAAYPERAFEAATVGRAVYGSAPRGATVTVVRLPRLGPQLALERLAALVELFDEGLREPLPIACKSSAAYAEALRRGGDPVKAATGEWDGPWNFAGEGEDLEHQLSFGGILPFEELLGSTAFAAYASRLWDDVLAWEQVEYR
jgi:exodeoxyribonuclease V gamma subunit